MQKTKTAGGVVLNPKGQVLVVNQLGTTWSLPKGHIDQGEDAIEAAKREIFEESGVSELEFIKRLGEYQRFKIGLVTEEDKSELKSIEMFLFKTSQLDLKPVDPANPEARWVDKEDVEKLLTHHKDKDFFTSIKNQI